MIQAVDVAHYYIGCMFKFTYNEGDIIYSKLSVLHDYGFCCGDVEWVEEDGKIRKPIKDVDDWFEINDIKTDGKFELILTSTWDLTKAQNKEYLELCYKVVDLKDGKSICRYADTPLSMRYLFINHVL